MEKILSVVIPSYNMEKYLHICLDSLLRHDVPSTLEVIVVNDGSKDNTLSIAREYEAKHSDIVKVIDKQNGNYGSCINEGLKIATGKFFRILDADDWFDTDGLVSFLSHLETCDSDMVFTNYATIREGSDKKVSFKSADEFYLYPISVDDPLVSKLKFKTDFTMHRVTYKTSLLKDVNYSQTTGISYTDLEYIFYPLEKVQKISFCDIDLYQYRIGRDGQTVSPESKIAHASDFGRVGSRILDNYNKVLNDKNKNVVEYIASWIIACYYHPLIVLKSPTQDEVASLKYFDEKVKSTNAGLYSRTGRIKCIGIPYILIWRKLRIKIIPTSVYDFLLNIKSKIGD